MFHHKLAIQKPVSIHNKSSLIIAGHHSLLITHHWQSSSPVSPKHSWTIKTAINHQQRLAINLQWTIDEPFSLTVHEHFETWIVHQPFSLKHFHESTNSHESFINHFHEPVKTLSLIKVIHESFIKHCHSWIINFRWVINHITILSEPNIIH